MTVLVVETIVRETQRNSRRELFRFQGKHADLQTRDSGKVSLKTGQSKTIVSTKMLCVYFLKPTVIQLTVGTAVTALTADGMLLMPCACAITVAHDGVVTDPLEFNYVVA